MSELTDWCKIIDVDGTRYLFYRADDDDGRDTIYCRMYYAGLAICIAHVKDEGDYTQEEFDAVATDTTARLQFAMLGKTLEPA